jgi:XTP/dITP diphosphohydrolase
VTALARRWVLATANRGKLAELGALLREAAWGPVELVAQSELGVPPAAETGTTFIENALLKARHAALHSGLPAIADDSGLTVAALQGAPGVQSARFAGPNASDAANVAKLLEALTGVPARDRAARFHCVLVALEHPDDPAPSIATGEWTGEITLMPRGRGGFGYDPVFFDPRLGRTAAELTADEKNAVSHRARALLALVDALRDRG